LNFGLETLLERLFDMVFETPPKACRLSGWLSYNCAKALHNDRKADAVGIKVWLSENDTAFIVTPDYTEPLTKRCPDKARYANRCLVRIAVRVVVYLNIRSAC